MIVAVLFGLRISDMLERKWEQHKVRSEIQTIFPLFYTFDGYIFV